MKLCNPTPTGPAKRPVSYQLTESGENVYRVAFVTTEVGSYVVDVAVSGQKVQGSPFIAKAYDAGLIRVSDVPNGVVGQPCQFRGVSTVISFFLVHSS